MANLGNFNANEHEPSKDFSPIPADWYLAALTKSELKNTKDNTGQYLNLEFTVIDGKFKNRKVFTNLNIKNKNPDAQAIAKSQLGDICRAVSVMNPKDSSELHNKPLKIKVTFKPASNGYEEGNEIKGFKPAKEEIIESSVEKKPWEA